MTRNQPIWGSPPGTAPTFAPLRRDLDCDVAIIGGGMVGLHAAWSLRASGLRVVLLEARRIGRQATGRSTAKVTSQHGLRYAQMVETHGRDVACLYAEHNQRAVATVADLCRDMQGGVSFEEHDAYVVARTEEEAAQLRRETDMARSLGLPASLELPRDLPIGVRSAMRFTGQGQFDPIAYQLGLAALVSASTAVFEESRVVSLKDEEPARLSVNGQTVRAAKVIVATQMPFPSEGKFFAKAFPVAHAVAAAPCPDDVTVNGMFITAGPPSWSLRTAEHQGRRFLVAAGPEYKPGEPSGQKEAVDYLLAFLRDSFGTEATHLWTNEDFRPADGLPFVGSAASGTDRLFVATGFDAWGITNGVVAGEVLAAAVTGGEHPAAAIFEPRRTGLAKGPGAFLKENLKAGLHLAGDRLFRAKAVPLSEVAPGDGGVVSVGGEQLAVRRSPEGEVTALSAVCTHMGCIVDWNAVDETWDCPCHGSRFDRNGEVIAGPATERLEVWPAPSGQGTS